MRRKSIKAILLIAAVLMMTVVFAACEKDEDSGNPSDNVVNQQSGDGVNLPDIPPGAVRERQDEGSQTFEIDLNDPDSGSFSHSFSIDENNMDGSHSVSVDEHGNIIP